MSLIEHAERELNLLNSGDDMDELMREQILDIVRLFESQGHSGFSSAYTIPLINKLLKQEPIKPLLGTADEWILISNDLFQNRRYGRVFKENGKAYNAEGIVFVDQDGNEFTNINSRTPIKFPYTPKTKYVKIIEKRKVKNEKI